MQCRNFLGMTCRLRSGESERWHCDSRRPCKGGKDQFNPLMDFHYVILFLGESTELQQKLHCNSLIMQCRQRLPIQNWDFAQHLHQSCLRWHTVLTFKLGVWGMVLTFSGSSAIWRAASRAYDKSETLLLEISKGCLRSNAAISRPYSSSVACRCTLIISRQSPYSPCITSDILHRTAWQCTIGFCRFIYNRLPHLETLSSWLSCCN